MPGIIVAAKEANWDRNRINELAVNLVKGLFTAGSNEEENDNDVFAEQLSAIRDVIDITGPDLFEQSTVTKISKICLNWIN